MTSKQAIKAPKTSKEAPSGDHITAHISLADAVSVAVTAGVLDVTSKMDMIIAMAMSYIVGSHLAPKGKSADLGTIETAIVEGIDGALKLPADTSRTQVYNYQKTAKDLYRLISGVPRGTDGKFEANKAGSNFGHPVSDIATAKSAKAAFEAFRDYVRAECCKSTGQIKPTMSGLEAYTRGSASNGAAVGGGGNVRTALDKLDNVQAAQKAKGMGNNLSKVLAGRDSAGTVATVNSLVNAVPTTETVEMLVVQAFERLVKLSPGTAVKVASKLTGIAAIAASNMPAQSTDAPVKPAAPETIAPKAPSEAAEKIAAENNAKVRAKRGNPSKATVA